MIDDTAPEYANGSDAEADDDEAGQPIWEQLRDENAALKEQVLRYAAEAENTRRRAEREANDARAYAIQRFARDLLGVADNLARAFQHAPTESTDPVVTNFVAGVALTEKELATAFERNGLKRVAPGPGDRFDPNLHQAMMEQPSDTVAGGAVMSTMQPGYELFGRIVRPALVVVAAKGSGAKVEGAYAQPDTLSFGATVDTKA